MKAKKSLGQNFLESEEVVESVISSANLTSGDVVLEIGPGKGILTKQLLERASQVVVVAIEKDGELFNFLNNKFKKEIKEEQLILIHNDILNFKLENHPLLNLKGGYKLIANIPYYITGQIFRKFLQTKNQPQKIVLMIQKEVAERIIAEDKKESLLSLSVKVFGRPKIVRLVSAKHFSPQPKVDSAILEISDIKNPFKNTIEENIFFDLIKTGFAHKRKILLNNLKGIENLDSKKILEECELEKNIRPENLSLNDWLCLIKNI